MPAGDRFCNAEAPHLEKLHQTYRDRGVQALIIDVMETPEVAKGWAERWRFSFPVLLDPDGKATAPWAPPDAVPDLPRDQVPIASNMNDERRPFVDATDDAAVSP